MSSVKHGGSVTDGIQKLVQQVSTLGLMPDATPDDMKFLADIQQVLTGFARQRGQQGQSSGPPNAGQPQTGPGGPPGGAPGGPMPSNGGDTGPGGAMPGLVPQGINPDELRRMLSGGQ